MLKNGAVQNNVGWHDRTLSTIIGGKKNQITIFIFREREKRLNNGEKSSTAADVRVIEEPPDSLRMNGGSAGLATSFL